MPRPNPATTPEMSWTRWLGVLAIVALAATGVAAVTVALSDTTDASHEAMLAVSPAGTVELSGLSTDLQELYHAVADDADAMQAVRCYCGCEEMLAHGDLYECFVRPDGTWERHALGCAVCQGEARQVLAARTDGVPLDQIVADIDATYGSITTPQETNAWSAPPRRPVRADRHGPQSAALPS